MAEPVAPHFIIGMADKMPNRVTHYLERRYECSRCREYMWLLKAGQEMLERYPTAKPLCVRCYVRLRLSHKAEDVVTYRMPTELLKRDVALHRMDVSEERVDKINSDCDKAGVKVWTK